jgi:glucokinase
MSPIVAVDLGGTNIRAAHFPNPAPPPSSQSKSPTNASEGSQAVITRIIDAIQAQIPTDQAELRIGVGAPGPLDPRSGVIIEAPNLPGWVNIPLRSRLSEHFKCPVAIGNDANLAALSEWRFGAGQGTTNLVYLTISTGIGGGIIIEGELLLGSGGMAAELGHITVEPDGPLCGCGQRGHLEAVAAGPAIARHAIEMLQEGQPSILAEKLQASGQITAVDVGEAAKAGDLLARAAVERAGVIIGRCLASLAHVFNPDVFVLGGGVSQIGPTLFQPIERALREHVMHTAYLKDLRVVPAALGDDAGLVGAMVLASLL